ncbi:MAG: PEP-CTERM sorting domain-containing protein [Armatimonadetes bacterium]|nr:PEP-CTERM sorting domain-containing protein [Armatimonadota bacterium]
MFSRYIHTAFVAALVAFCVDTANAAPITLTYSGVATGSLGETPFSGVPFAFTFVTDTTLLSTPLFSATYPAQSNIALTVGATSTTFGGSTSPFLGPTAVTGLTDASSAFLVYGASNFAGYDFASNFFSANTTVELLDITNRPTGAGNLTITGITRPQFVSVVTVVPEAGTFALIGLGFAVCALTRRRAR